MEKVTEIFFEKELEDIVFNLDSVENWVQICKDLNLNKQLNLLGKNETSVIPYPFMNVSMIRMFEVLCPVKCEYDAYDKAPIPLNVLKQISFTLKEQHFASLEIWHNNTDADPILVGVTGKWGFFRDYYIDGVRQDFDTKEAALAFRNAKGDIDNGLYLRTESRYLIARWGAEAIDMNKLKQQALDMFHDTEKLKLTRLQHEVNDKLLNLRDNVLLYLSGHLNLSDVVAKRM